MRGSERKTQRTWRGLVLKGEERELSGAARPPAWKQRRLEAVAPKHSHKHQLSNAQRSVEVLEAQGSEHLERQNLNLLVKE